MRKFTGYTDGTPHIKNVPGRKTDVKDARWLSQLLQHGLIQPSFVPPQEQPIAQTWVQARSTRQAARWMPTPAGYLTVNGTDK